MNAELNPTTVTESNESSEASGTETELVVWIDGEMIPKSQAKVSVYDHGFLYGDGVFEGIRAYNGRVFRLDEHVARLYDSAKAIWLQIPMSQEQTRKEVVRTLQVNKLHDGYIRLIATRGVGDLGLDPHNCPTSSMIIITDRIQLFPQELYKKGIEVVTVSTRRNSPQVLSPAIKSMNYLNNILGKIEATEAGYAEGLMLNLEGMVCEGTGENLFLVKDDQLITPPTHVGILKGITRNAVIELAAMMGIPCSEKVIILHDVYTADETFFTGTGAELMPVVKADNRTIGNGSVGPLTQRLMQGFRDLTQRDGTPI